MLKASNILAGRNFDVKKKTQMVEKPNSGERNQLWRRESIFEAKWESYGGPILWPWDLWDLPEIFCLLSSCTWPLTARTSLLSTRPNQQTRATIFTSFTNSLHLALPSVAKFSLYVFFSFVSNLHASKVLTKGTVLEIKLNPAGIMVMGFQRTLKFVWL